MEGVWEEINEALRERERMRQGREPTPSAAIIDSQSVRITEKGAAKLRRRQEDKWAKEAYISLSHKRCCDQLRFEGLVKRTGL